MLKTDAIAFLFFIVLLPEKSGTLFPTLPDDRPFIPLMKTELPEKIAALPGLPIKFATLVTLFM